MWTTKTLAKKTNISEPALNLVLSALIKNELLTTTGKDNKQLIPCQSLENITLDMILNAVRSAEETAKLRPEDVVTVTKVDDALLALQQAITQTGENISLKDLIQDSPD
jgi:DNA-binding IscR family transcriptional regulator